ncbi:MAG: D-glycerate dehydrogenase [Bacteroidetes bacterium]|nr:D-glycerate dehydrogenase [Rhodothermia bacterium]MCS7155011.1 D-glycerate dehydrogenase [Bacteroidota bacterium]MCX7907295.1 D-glycerate dehydrogenase [Bacteroidota bacterium]MDW8137978.1 D-glycerate dehydrogenase [Bacteroidota bacterium]MDW8286170.1 D-glycerate dehydrogenase [Bacteroidota bacterium]
MKYKVFVTYPIPEAGLRLLREQAEVLLNTEDRFLTEEEIIAAAQEADALLSLLQDPITARVIESLPRLKIIANYAVGYNNIDIAAATRRRVLVTNTPDVLTDATADLTMALILAVARHVVQADRFVRQGRFTGWKPNLWLGLELRGKVLGIVGMGRIGYAVARRAVAFGMDVLYHNRRPANPTLTYLVGAQYVSLEELLERADVVSLHCPLTPETYHLIDRRALARLKPTAILINTARGPVVDETALVEALQAGRIAGAGLDVFEEEPRVHPALLELPNVVLTPHIGSATREARERMAVLCAESIIAALSGRGPVPRVVNPEALT